MRQVFYYKMQQFYYKMQHLLRNVSISLQNAILITKCDVYYKIRRYNVSSPHTRKTIAYLENDLFYENTCLDHII